MNPDPQSALRVGNADDAYALFQQAGAANADLFASLQTVEDFVDGGNPNSPEELALQGNAEASNVNFLTADGLCQDVENTFWNRAFAEQTLVTVTPRPGADPESRSIIGALVSDEFTKFLKSLPFFPLNMRAAVADYIRIGRAFRFFPDPKGIQDEVLRFSDVLLPSRYSVDPTKWEVFFVRRSESISRLFSLVRDEVTAEASRAEGYDVTEIRRMLYDKLAVYEREEEAAAKAELLANFREDHPAFASFWESAVGNSMSNEFADTEQIPVVYLFTKEFSGKWSARAFTTIKGDGQRKFYRDQEDAYECVFSILCPAFYQPRRTATDARSFVHKAYNPLVANNEILNSMVDFLPWLTSLIADKGEGGANPKAITVRGKGGIITIDGATVNAQAMQAIRGDAAMGVYKILSGAIENQRKHSPSNLGSSNMGSVQPLSAEEAQALQATVADAQISAIDIHDAQVIHYYRELFRRAIRPPTPGAPCAEEIKEFHENLKTLGVRVSDLQDACVQITPSIGYGNTAARVAAIRECLTGADQLGIDPYGKAKLQRLFLVSRLGANAAQEILPAFGAHRPTDSEREAYKENLFLAAGQAIPVLGFDEHLSHFQAHYNELIAPLVKAIQTQAQFDIPRAHQALAATIPHLQEHAQRLGNQKQATSQALAQSFTLAQQVQAEVARRMQELQAQDQARAQQEAAAKQQQLDVQAQLKKYEIELAAANKRLDTLSQSEARMQKAMADIARKDAIALADMNRS